MPDGFVQVQPDSSGKKVDTNELTKADGTIVERQRVETVPNYSDTSSRHALEAEALLLMDQVSLAYMSRGRERISSYSQNRGQR